MRASVERILNGLDAATAPEACGAAVRPVLADLGFSALHYVCVDLPLDGEAEPLVVTSLGDRWRQTYLETGAYRDDVILTRCIRSVLPVRWDTNGDGAGLSDREAAVLKLMAEAGLAVGAAIPVHAPGGRFASFCVAADGQSRDLDGLLAETEPMLLFIAARFHDAVQRSRPPSPVTGVSLTAREGECLQWAAQGKTSWETAMILDVAEVTVNFHLKNVMKKLGVANRVHAVARAVAFGLIEP